MTAPHPSPRGRPKPLSRREQSVLMLMAEGMTNTEIANSLDLARSTVKTYVSSILWKLDVRTRREAVRKTINHAVSPCVIEEPRQLAGKS
jgi:DNA-binding NarL/FixJ family response regulator